MHLSIFAIMIVKNCSYHTTSLKIKISEFWSVSELCVNCEWIVCELLSVSFCKNKYVTFKNMKKEYFNQ